MTRFRPSPRAAHRGAPANPARGPGYPSVFVAALPTPVANVLAAAATSLGGTHELHAQPAPSHIPPHHHIAVLPADPDVIANTRAHTFDGAILAVDTANTPDTDDWAAQCIRAGADDATHAAQLNPDNAPAIINKALALADARRAGATDLAAAIADADNANQRADRLTERVALLESQAWTDPLTGLANRRQLFARLDRMFAESIRYDSDLSCAMLDLDGFKLLNDQLGHRKGDDCLKHAARAVSESVRASDVAARYGGDEFVILMPRTPLDEAARVARRAADAFHKAIAKACPSEVAPGLSVGISSVNATKPLDAEGLIDAADKAMYASKAQRQGNIMVARHGQKPVIAPTG